LANTLIINKPFILNGLPTWTYTVPTAGAGPYSVHVESTEGPSSGVSILVKKGGVTQYTADTLSPTQGLAKFKFGMLLADADVVTVVMASSQSNATDIDNQLNSVKTTVTIQQGF
jgi:hypothetical protein